MEYIIIFVVVCMVAGPIFWMMPSPRQKRLTEWRNYAISKGLKVKISNLPQTHRMQVRKEPVQQKPYYQLLFNKPFDDIDSFNFCLIKTAEGVEWLEQRKPAQAELLLNCLNKLPERVLALNFSNTAVGVYWTEEGEKAQIDTIYQQLQLLQQQLIS